MGNSPLKIDNKLAASDIGLFGGASYTCEEREKEREHEGGDKSEMEKKGKKGNGQSSRSCQQIELSCIYNERCSPSFSPILFSLQR